MRVSISTTDVGASAASSAVDICRTWGNSLRTFVRMVGQSSLPNGHHATSSGTLASKAIRRVAIRFISDGGRVSWLSYRMVKLGIDLGGTKIEGIALDEHSAELCRLRVATRADQGYAHILERVTHVYRALIAKVGAGDHTLGIGTPGALSRRSDLLRNSNTVALNGKPLAQDLARLLGRPFTLANDANCFALAEARLGAARGASIAFGVIMGTGCGGGLIVDGRVHVGRLAIGGEWGHMSIDPDGPPCYCGQRGCVETFISGSGIEARHAERTGARCSAIDIVAGFRQGDEACVATMSVFFDRFGRALANLIDVLDPDVVVLGGGLSNIDELYTLGVDAVCRQVFADAFDTPIVRHTLGDSAGVIGAALIGR